MKLILTLKELAYITKLVGKQNGLDKEEILRDANKHSLSTIEDTILSTATYADLNGNLYSHLNQTVKVARNNRTPIYKVLYKLGEEFHVTKEYYLSEADYDYNSRTPGTFVQLIKESEKGKISGVEIELVC